MTRTRRDAPRVPSVHETADILRACELQARKRKKGAKSAPEATSRAMSVPDEREHSDAPEIEIEEVSRMSARETRNRGGGSRSGPSEPSPKRRRLQGRSDSAKRQTAPEGSPESPVPRTQRFRGLRPIGAATVARQLAEIDLRTPETPKPVGGGVPQVSQAQARLFDSPPADGQTTESNGKRRGSRQKEYPPSYMEAVKRHLDSAQKARERWAEERDGGADEVEILEVRESLGALERAEMAAPELGAPQVLVPERGTNKEGSSLTTEAGGDPLMDAPQSLLAADEILDNQQDLEAQEVPRSAGDLGGSLEEPQTSGAEHEPQSEHEMAVNAAVKLLKKQLLGWDGGGRIATDEFQAHQRKLYTLLADTVDKGLNVSALLLGPRGGGKSAIVEGVIRDLQEAYQERVTVVRLNGLVHADERTALKEIARQLCEDNDLAISSKTSTFELNLRFLTDILTECVKAHRAVIFVLDEFDLFAQRPKQTLLYNLLDAIQSSKTQAAVVGISCRMDADELLEKRVRSRFSHRRLQVVEPTADELPGILADALQLPPLFPHADFASRFNKQVETVLADSEVQSILDVHVSRNQSPRHLLDLGFRALCCMDRNRGCLTVDDVKAARDAAEIEPRVESIRGLSVLELYLLITMKRLEEKERDKYNFQTVFAEYQELRLYNTADVYSRGVSLRAFQHLVGRELVTFADRRPRGDPVEFRPVKLLVSPAEIERALAQHPARSSVLEQWFANKAAGKF